MNAEILIQKYLDFALTPEEHRELNRLLREDAEVRATFCDVAEQALVLGDIGRVGRMEAPETPAPVRRSPVSWLALAAGIVLLAAAVAVWMADREEPVLKLVEGTGGITWSRGGEFREVVLPGSDLADGTIETVGDSATARLSFRDGSVIDLAGETELSFSEDGQKRLFLRRGSLNARVMPQPEGHPMVVRTPSAEAHVVGTAFHLAARPEDTLLNVEEGLVTLKRLVDGDSVDVPAKSTAVASLDSGLSLAPASTPEPLAEWGFDFTTTLPPRIWRGVWKDGPSGGIMTASPYVAGKKGDGKVVTHFGVSIRTAYLEPSIRLVVQEGSFVRYRLRLRESVPMQLMLLTNRTNGDFGGNFECKLSADLLRPLGGGWYELVVPVESFQPAAPDLKRRQRYPSPIGNVVTSAILSTFQRDAGLEIAEFSLGTGGVKQ